MSTTKDTKTCTKCRELKPQEEYYKKPNKSDERRAVCKACWRSANARYLAENRENILAQKRVYHHKNRGKLSAKNAVYYSKNREHFLRYQEEYRNGENRERYLENKKKHNKSKRGCRTYRNWIEQNRKRVREKRNERTKVLLRTDPVYKLAFYLRSRLRKVLIRGQKTGSAVSDLGCSAEELKQHLESQFNSRMNWKNWGTYWHIDHIYPLAAANLEDRCEFLAVVNWQNLQPLTATANLKKNDEVTPAAKRLFNKLVKQFESEAAA